MRRTVLLAAVLAVTAAACSVDFGEAGDRAGGATLRSSSAPIPKSREPVAAVVDRVLPAVVSVTTDVFRADFTQGQGVGTGFVVADGVIVTNCHVIEGASRITVSTSDERPDRYDARVIGGDCPVWQQLFWPQPFNEATAFGLLRHWAAQTHAPQLILEARADVTGVEYLIGSQLRHAPGIRRAVEQLVDGAIVTRSETDRPRARCNRAPHPTEHQRPPA